MMWEIKKLINVSDADPPQTEAVIVAGRPRPTADSTTGADPTQAECDTDALKKN